MEIIANDYSRDNPGRPFEKGNPGRPVGMRHCRTLIAQALVDNEAETITQKCIDLALAGDPTALMLSMERLVPPRKEWPVEFTLRPLQSGADATAAMAAIMQAASEGKILLSQAVEFAKLLQLYGKMANSIGIDEVATLTDEELRARILRKQAEAAVDVDWHEAAAADSEAAQASRT